MCAKWVRDGQYALKRMRAVKGVLQCVPENADELVRVLNATVTENESANDENEKGFEPTSIELANYISYDPARLIRGCVILPRPLAVATHCARGLRLSFLVVTTSGTGADASFLR